MTRIAVIFALCCLATAGFALPVAAPRPGGIAIVELGASGARPRAIYDGSPVLVRRDGDAWYAVVGLSLRAEPGRHSIDVTAGDARRSVAFEVQPHDYREQHLEVERKYVAPDAEALERIGRERQVIDAALAGFSEREPDSLRFAAPVPGRQSPSFGFRRVFNGEPRAPHSGMDIAAPAGTPILAPLAGTVAVTGDFYFNGNTVIVDHGRGLVTLYCHLDRIDVRDGEGVAVGARLGLVGATGRVTGAHLHFGTYLNGNAVDPALFLASDSVGSSP